MRVLFLVLVSSLPTILSCVVAYTIAGKTGLQALDVFGSTSGGYFLIVFLWANWLLMVNDGLVRLGVGRIRWIGVELRKIPSYGGLEGDLSEPLAFRQRATVGIIMILGATGALTHMLVKSS